MIALPTPSDGRRQDDGGRPGGARQDDGPRHSHRRRDAPPARDGHRPDELLLAGGACLRVRRLAPSDRERLAAFFERLSDQSRHRRFLGPKPRLSAAELTYLTEIDHVSHEALAAIDDRDGSIVGVSRYARWRDREDVAEMAVAVADDLQGRGVGTALTRRIVDRASANGIARLTASTFWDNAAARALLRRLGFRVLDGGAVLDFYLDLPATGARACA